MIRPDICAAENYSAKTSSLNIFGPKTFRAKNSRSDLFSAKCSPMFAIFFRSKIGDRVVVQLFCYFFFIFVVVNFECAFLYDFVVVMFRDVFLDDFGCFKLAVVIFVISGPFFSSSTLLVVSLCILECFNLAVIVFAVLSSKHDFANCGCILYVIFVVVNFHCFVGVF